ncbi:formate/nitrite transporter family protein [Mycolicibacterium sp.]|jgi:formate/nitrite transporter FocA (FNT family)|uniref:formate/nitrite transporter family protein n=1 Tax=Mycolicibacterium sp. TaxID=2320850 RepID=UPI0028AEE0F6|nr:formate/nitrite transporter family protein [Mycolicibacterium sp.]
MSAPSEGLGINEKLFPGRQFISTVLDLLDTKSKMSGRLWRVYLMRAAMAGIIISVFYLAFYGVQAGFDQVPVSGEATMQPIGKFFGAIVFGFALVFIYFTKSELLTSNMMVGSIGVYYKHGEWPRVLRILGLCYLGNFLGGVFIAALLRASTLLDGGLGTIMGHSVETKLGYITEGAAGWGDLLVRAILCNFLINVAMLLCYNGMIKGDITKVASMIAAVFLFAFLGLEHSVANTELFLIYGMHHGINVGAAVGNVAVALVGNFIGGGLLIGVYYAYANDFRRAQLHGLITPDTPTS